MCSKFSRVVKFTTTYKQRLTWQWNLVNSFNLGYETVNVNYVEYFRRNPYHLNFSANRPDFEVTGRICFVQSAVPNHIFKGFPR